MKKHIKSNVHWVGKVDWELRKFHGDEYSTHNGSSYNSYLIQEEKNVLIDTVWAPFAAEFVDNLASEIELDKIDYIVINHGEGTTAVPFRSYGAHTRYAHLLQRKRSKIA